MDCGNKEVLNAVLRKSPNTAVEATGYRRLTADVRPLKMNDLFIRETGDLVAMALILTLAASVLLTHVSYAVAKCRGFVDTRYHVFMKKWLLRRALPSAIALTFLLMLLVTVPAAFLAWYRTRLVHDLSCGRLLLRVHDPIRVPLDGGGYRMVYEVCRTTTNTAEIGELLEAIRFSPTYPNAGCLCPFGCYRKFEIASVSRSGYEWPLTTFTVPHDQSIRFEHDWYGDWHLWPDAQTDLTAWQHKYISNQQRSNNVLHVTGGSSSDAASTVP